MANTLELGNGKWATGKDTVLAFNDENNNFKPLPFSFSRDTSGTIVNKDGLIETVGSGEPRIDFKDNTKGALLLEPQRSNVIDNSSNFFVGSWSGTRVSEGSTINAPDGDNEAHKLIANSVNNTHYREYTLSSASSGSYTGSCFFKKGEYNVACIRMSVDSYANRYSIYIDLNDGSFLRDATVGSPTGTSYKIEDYGNGWYRLSVSIIHTSGEVRMSLSNASSNYSNSNGLPVFLGNNSDGGYSWGGQLESGSYATSYIPTFGSAATRSADVCNNGGNEQVINSTEGVLYIESKSLNNTVALNRKIVLGDGSYNNGIEFSYQTTTNKMQFIIRSGGSISMKIETTFFDVTEFNKIAISYKSNQGKVFVNGSQIGVTDTSVTTPIGLRQLDFKFATAFDFEGNVKDARVYNTELTDQELIALTQ